MCNIYLFLSFQFNANNDKDDDDVDNPKIIDLNSDQTAEGAVGNDNGSDSIMSVSIPQGKSNSMATPSSSQIIWIPAGIPQSSMFNIKQLNYSQVMVTLCIHVKYRANSTGDFLKIIYSRKDALIF